MTGPRTGPNAGTMPFAVPGEQAACTAVVLEAQALSCGYGGGHPPVLAGLDLIVPEGRLICVIGPNGSGKSTLARTLSGLLPPATGVVNLRGRHLGSYTPLERARIISVVLTRLPMTGYMTVRSFVEIGRHPYTGILGRMTPDDHDAVDRAIDQVDVAQLSARLLSEISDGERQRAAIARAFAQGAALMILDEPTAFLDVESRAVVMTTLRSLAHGTGRSVVATSHDIDLVLRVADEVWMIGPDRALRTGAPEDMVLAGEMDTVFPNHVMRFDLESGGFRLPHPTGSSLIVEGAGMESIWTIRALERIGMRVEARDSGGHKPRIEVGSGPDRKWMIHDPSGTHSFDSIAGLVEHLRKTSAFAAG